MENFSFLSLPRSAFGVFQMNVFACNLTSARGMAVDVDDTVYVASKSAGLVFGLRDVNNDHLADEIILVAEGLKQPNGIAIHNGVLYIATQTDIVKITNPYDPVSRNISLLYSNIFPAGATAAETGLPHPLLSSASASYLSWHALHISFDEGDGNYYLYSGIGTGCIINCVVDQYNSTSGTLCDPCDLSTFNDYYATIARWAIDGSTVAGEIVATGVRYSGGLSVNPANDDIWFSENGSDGGVIGAIDDEDEMNVIHASNLTLDISSFYQYPLCSGASQRDQTYWGIVNMTVCANNSCCIGFGDDENLGEHDAPLGVIFKQNPSLNFPISEYQINTGSNDTQLLFIANHGSAALMHGFVSLIVMEGSQATQAKPFVSQFWNTSSSTGKPWARPNDLNFLSDGSLLISDDYSSGLPTQGTIFILQFFSNCFNPPTLSSNMQNGTCFINQSSSSGYLFNITSGDDCNATCDYGYIASGSLQTTCFNGSFTPIAGQCLPMPCYESPLLSLGETIGTCNISTTANQTFESGSNCTLACDSIHSSNGSLVLNCSLGNWIYGNNGYCNPNCATLPTLPTNSENGNCTENFPSGKTCSLSCANGFNTVGSLLFTCNENGMWINVGETGSCQQISQSQSIKSKSKRNNSNSHNSNNITSGGVAGVVIGIFALIGIIALILYSRKNPSFSENIRKIFIHGGNNQNNDSTLELKNVSD